MWTCQRSPWPPKPAAPVSPTALGSGDRHSRILRLLLASFPRELRATTGPGLSGEHRQQPRTRGLAPPRTHPVPSAPHGGLRSQPLAWPASFQSGVHRTRGRRNSKQNEHPGTPTQPLLRVSSPAASLPETQDERGHRLLIMGKSVLYRPRPCLPKDSTGSFKVWSSPLPLTATASVKTCSGAKTVLASLRMGLTNPHLQSH